MKKPNTIEAELDAIRLKLYEQTKDMTTSERVAFLTTIEIVVRLKPAATALKRKATGGA